MQRARERIMLNITWRERKTAPWIREKKQSTRYHGNDKQTQIGLGWSEEPLDNRHCVLDTPGTHKEPKEDQG